MIAKRIPTDAETRGNRADVAAAYGLTLIEFNNAAADWICSEGYDGMGNEYETLHDWLTGKHQDNIIDKTPYQKSDDLDN